MSEEELVFKTNKKVEKFEEEIGILTDRLYKTLENIKDCRAACRATSIEIGEFNGRAQSYY